MDVKVEFKFCINAKINWGGGWSGGGGGGWVGGSGGQGGCERRMKVFVKIQQKKIGGVGVGGGGGWVRSGWWGGGGGVRVDVNEELKFL